MKIIGTKKLAFFLLISSMYVTAKHDIQYAVVISPIVDIGEPASLKLLPSHASYYDIPISGGNIKQSLACKRIHQLIYNEVVEVVQQRFSKLLIKIPNFFFTVDSAEPFERNYWVDKKDFVLFKDMKKKGLDTNKIPEQISVSNPNNFGENVATLALPFTDKETGITYSAGVRFKKMGDQKDPSAIKVYRLNPENFTIQSLRIPHHFLIKNCQTRSQKIKQFVQLVKRWAHFNNGSVPYVWGGGSLMYVTDKSFTQKMALDENHETTSFFELDGYTFSPKPGLDCSNLILRAAQICDIPYFYKNSSTVAQYLKNIEDDEHVEEGDIIAIKGHVLIVTSMAKNLVVEARSYSHGFGKIHEIGLNKVFKDMNSFQDLHNAMKNKNTLQRLDSQGKIADKFPTFKILKLASAWKD